MKQKGKSIKQQERELRELYAKLGVRKIFGFDQVCIKYNKPGDRKYLSPSN